MTVRRWLIQPAPHSQPVHIGASVCDADPYGLDLQLALYMCYELHYRGFAGADPAWEWHPALLDLRAQLERIFLTGLHRDIGPIDAHHTAIAEIESLIMEPIEGADVSHYLRDHATWDQMREYFVHRSLSHLKEGDPHAWAIPRLSGPAKASFVALEFAEYGAGRGQAMRQSLFADLLTAADLDATYAGYLDAVPAESLAVVNLMSLFGLHRRWRGAAVGHFAATEITSPPGSRQLVAALQRLGAPAACLAFYCQHAQTGAAHGQAVRRDVVGDLLAREPHLERDVVFGIRAYNVVESRLSETLLTSWKAGQTSLRRPLH
nr:iron-containing redox enzyme family protein [Mycobacterium botniense]